MTRGPALADGEAARTACARVLIRGGTGEKTGEALSAAAVAERVAWCAALVKGMAAQLTAAHWETADLHVLSSGRDGAGRPLPSQAWMALRRLGWDAAPPGRAHDSGRAGLGAEHPPVRRSRTLAP